MSESSDSSDIDIDNLSEEELKELLIEVIEAINEKDEDISSGKGMILYVGHKIEIGEKIFGENDQLRKEISMIEENMNV